MCTILGCSVDLYGDPTSALCLHSYRRNLFLSVRAVKRLESGFALRSSVHQARSSRLYPLVGRAFVYLNTSPTTEDVLESWSVDARQEGFGTRDAVQGPHDSVGDAQKGGVSEGYGMFGDVCVVL